MRFRRISFSEFGTKNRVCGACVSTKLSFWEAACKQGAGLVERVWCSRSWGSGGSRYDMDQNMDQNMDQSMAGASKTFWLP